jgi:citrate lyase subunit beta/citryl-CoA lyase
MLILRTLLFVPAIRPRMLDRASASGADAVVIDLEDAVPPGEKQPARDAAARAIAAWSEAAPPIFVRVNAIDSELTRDDLLSVVRPDLAGVVLPKAADAQDIRDLDVLLREAEMANAVRPGDTAVIPLIESARGVLRCEEIALASDRITALSIGGEDYSNDIGVVRDAGGAGLQHIRAVVVQVAAAHGLHAIDTPYADFGDERGLLKDARTAREIGMKGKFVIHPSQIAAVNRVFTPSAAEVTHARRIVDAFERAMAARQGAVSLDGRMVDAPVAERARAVIALADAVGARRPARRQARARSEVR